MGEYIPFSREDVDRASQTNLEEFLRRRGEMLKRSGSEWQWGEGSNKVTVRENEWFHQYELVGGDAIAFVRRWYNLNFPEAVTFLLKEQNASVPEPLERAEYKKRAKQKKPFALPPAHSDMRRVYGYLLNRRFIDREVITFFTRQKMLYEDAAYHNAVFVGYDESGVARHAHKRSTYSDSDFKGNVDSSQPEYSFHWIGGSDRLYVFEAPIDLLSYLTLHSDGWQKHSYVALCCAGLQAAVYQAQQNAYVREVIVCTDYDEAGIEAYYRIREALAETSRITVLREHSCYKDWNEDIQAQHGLTPIPGGEHPRIEHIRELCGQILDSGLPPYPPHPLEQLRKKVETLAGTPASNQLEIQEQACAVAGLALSFCRQRMRQLGIEWQPEKLIKRIMNPYQPHRDHIGYHSRIRDLEDCMQSILRQFGADRIYTESELKQEMSQTLDLALHCLRLHTFLELQTPEQAAMLAM